VIEEKELKEIEELVDKVEKTGWHVKPINENREKFALTVQVITITFPKLVKEIRRLRGIHNEALSSILKIKMCKLQERY